MRQRCSAFRRHLRIAVAFSMYGCQAQLPEQLPGTFRFAVMGDAPYSRLEEVRFNRVIGQLNNSDLTTVISVGDILWYPCSDSLFQTRLASLQSVRHPLVYTPGDNEWTDCHEPIAGSYEPLERLSRLRALFFEEPTTSLGGNTISLTVQATDSAWAEFVENVRWTQTRFVFSTIHLVGSKNGLYDFGSRTDRDDDEVSRRTEAATAWLRSTFEFADSIDALGVVIATHADLVFEDPADDYRDGFEPFLESLELAVEQFEGPVLLVHGDSHQYIVDRPLVRRTTGGVLDNLTRLQVLGSPDVGWVEVAVDTSAAYPFRFAAHRVPRWTFW